MDGQELLQPHQGWENCLLTINWGKPDISDMTQWTWAHIDNAKNISVSDLNV